MKVYELYIDDEHWIFPSWTSNELFRDKQELKNVVQAWLKQLVDSKEMPYFIAQDDNRWGIRNMIENDFLGALSYINVAMENEYSHWEYGGRFTMEIRERTVR